MQGLHLTADLHHCRCDSRWLTDAALLGERCLQAVAHVIHAFPGTAQGPGGVTATVLLAESHLCVHTWPEQLAVTLDVYVCNFGGDHSIKAHALMAALTTLFDPAQLQQNSLMRGNAAEALNAVAVKLDDTFGRVQSRGDIGRAGRRCGAGESD